MVKRFWACVFFVDKSHNFVERSSFLKHASVPTLRGWNFVHGIPKRFLPSKPPGGHYHELGWGTQKLKRWYLFDFFIVNLSVATYFGTFSFCHQLEVRSLRFWLIHKSFSILFIFGFHIIIDRFNSLLTQSSSLLAVAYTLYISWRWNLLFVFVFNAKSFCLER